MKLRISCVRWFLAETAWPEAIMIRYENLWGAGLDVYEREPIVEEGLINLKNVVLLPHLGSASEETREKMTEMAVENVVLTLSGKRPRSLVNPEVL